MMKQGGRVVGALLVLSIVTWAMALLFGGCTLDRGGTQQQECTSNAECPVFDANCQEPVCEGGFCDTDPKPDGPVTQQAVGDCALLACESGSTVLVPDPSDKPTDGPCATFTCNGAELVSNFAAVGTVCTLGAASGTCDGQGTCEIICEFDSQCPEDPSKPCESPFCNTAVGTCAFEPKPNGPSSNDMPNDCLLHLCEGGAEKTEYLALNVACAVDGGDVCDAVGSCKISGGKPCTTGSECLSNNCPADDGICCDAPCDGLCQSCKFADTNAPDGICAAVSTGTDPKNECPNGACDATGCKLDNGQSCTTGAQCLSGHCPGDDGVCCNQACNATCRSCIGSQTGGTTGTCGNVLAGTDPKSECTSTSTNCNSGNCAGTGASCGAKDSGVTCRAAANGGCDVAEVCDGSNIECPPDAKAPATTLCRAEAAGGCDQAEFCDGINNACPPDAKKPSTFECRAEAAGGCDQAEFCPGNSNTCPADAKKPSTFECRAEASGGCDQAEFCPGNSNTCPADAKKPNTFECRPEAAGGCDQAEFCPGNSNSCPVDGKKPNTFECRAANGACDQAEFCPGNANNCPSNSFKPDGATPDPPGCGFYLCDGTSASCPSSCSSNGDCTGMATCPMSVCCLPNGVSCQGSASNCCSGSCTGNGGGNCN
jgi:hypothetical protein